MPVREAGGNCHKGGAGATGLARAGRMGLDVAMDDHTRPIPSAPRAVAEDERRRRLAEALRANLRRRKSQARDRAAQDRDPPADEPERTG